MSEEFIYSWIKTPCGREKYLELNQRKGMLSKIRLIWFVIFAIIRDLPISDSNSQLSDDSES